ncbi:MAG: restriction endonuclease subunit S, partial [Myxococcales bacterium]|nr:restriction endonuclease subunit S [Myxococcales bacterium]
MASSNGWSSRPLRDCAVWFSGGTPNKATPRYWGGTIPWISAKSITGFFISNSEDRVTEDGARNGTRLVPPNTILFIVRGMSLKSEFRIGITTRPVTFNQDLKALVAVEDVVPAFLAYAIKAKTDAILGLVGEAGHGTGVLPTDRIQSLEIPTPSLPEQEAIAHILGALDDKIELNRRMNETLEAIARALFKSWFIDFDPVRAKMEGRAPTCMDPATAALFPDALRDGVPEGWPVLPLDEAAHFLNGLALQKYPAVNGEPSLPVVKITQLRVGSARGADRANLTVPESHRVSDGDLIFSWSGSLLVRQWAGGTGALNQHLFKVTSDRFPQWLIHGWLRQHLPSF